MTGRRVLLPDLTTYETVVAPPRAEEHCWAGAPSTLPSDDGLWLTYRLRTPEERGFALHLARSDGDLSFETMAVVRAEEIGVRSIERAALIDAPASAERELYLSYHRERWEIGRALPAWDDVREVQPLTPLLQMEEIDGVKDPFIAEREDGQWMLFTGYRGRRERTFAARRTAEGAWAPVSSEPLLPNEGWHALFTRPSCLLPATEGAVLYYEGCRGDEYEAIYNIRGGVALLRDWTNATDLTPDGPALASPTAGRYATVRYLAPATVADRLAFFYEAARRDGAFELRCSPTVERAL